MYQPKLGERVLIHPSNLNEKVQRGAGLHGQFLTVTWQECTWDKFLNSRLHDGSIWVKPYPSVLESPISPSADLEISIPSTTSQPFSE